MQHSLFEKTKVNFSRQLELDIAKGLAVIFMIAVHVLEEFSNEQVVLSPFGMIIEFLGGPPAAPVFMFLLGTGIVYSSKFESFLLFKRGIIIFFGGYILNIFRGTLPSLIAYSLTKDNLLVYQSFIEFVSVDILQFAGLTLIYFAIVKKLRLNLRGILATAFLFCIINIFVNMKIDNLFFASFCSLIWGANEISYFPFLSWIIYPIVGYCFGTFLIRCKDKTKFYLILLIVGLFFLLCFGFTIIGLFGIDLGMNDEYSYYHHNIWGNIVFLSFVIVWISFMFFISKGLVGILKSFVIRWSKNVTEIYFIHWIIIGYLSIFIYSKKCGLICSILITIILFIVSDVLAVGYLKFISKRK